MPTSSSRHPIVHDNILNHLNERDYFGFTANSVITSHYALVMGAGNAKAFKDRFPNLDVLLAVEINNDRFFHFVTTKYQNYHIFALQTKVHWKDRTPIKLLKDSLRHLELFAAQNKHLKFHLPTPGIGYGGLSCKQVYPLLDALHLDNLILYEI